MKNFEFVVLCTSGQSITALKVAPSTVASRAKLDACSLILPAPLLELLISLPSCDILP